MSLRLLSLTRARRSRSSRLTLERHRLPRVGADGDTLETLSDEIAAKMASSEVIEGTYTLKDAIRIILAFAAGKVSGGGTSSIKFRSTGDDCVLQGFFGNDKEHHQVSRQAGSAKNGAKDEE